MTWSCVACGCADGRPLFQVRGHEYLACARCGSASLSECPSDPTALYQAGYFDDGENGGYRGYDRDAALHSWTARRRLNRVARRMPAGPVTMLDIGCASGYVLEEAVRRDWHAVGVEVSATARDRAAARGLTAEATVADGRLRLQDPPTLVTAFQVMEHAPDPVSMLRDATAGSPPGTVVALETWDLGSTAARLFGRRWQQANPPSVLHLFTRPGLQALARRSGLVPISIRVTPKPVSLGLVAAVASDAWPRVGVPLTRALESVHAERLPLIYPLDDLVTLLAVIPASVNTNGLGWPAS